MGIPIPTAALLAFEIHGGAIHSSAVDSLNAACGRSVAASVSAGRATIPLGSNWGTLFTHVASPVSQLQETGVQKGVFGA